MLWCLLLLLSPQPTPALDPCAAFAEKERARRAAHDGPCPYCPCACVKGKVICAPCARCVEPRGPAPFDLKRQLAKALLGDAKERGRSVRRYSDHGCEQLASGALRCEARTVARVKEQHCTRSVGSVRCRVEWCRPCRRVGLEVVFQRAGVVWTSVARVLLDLPPHGCGFGCEPL